MIPSQKQKSKEKNSNGIRFENPREYIYLDITEK